MDDMRLINRFSAHVAKTPGLIFFSGQTPVDSAGNIVPGDIKVHTASLSKLYDVLRLTRSLQAQCISNISGVLKAAGSSWDKVVKVNVYLKSMGDFATMNEEYIKVCHISSYPSGLSHQRHSTAHPGP